jgi:CDGSH-type Zn-finger protein
VTIPSPTRDQIALCRYGHSGYPPFCDGTHVTIDFDGTSCCVAVAQPA